jgi:hypothetical protein
MRKVIFLHMPKTGGVSLRQWLCANYASEKFFPAHLVPQQVTFSIEALNQYSVFCGHLDWSGLDCIRGDRFLFTVLRRPVDRIISNFCYWKRIAERKSCDELEREDIAHLVPLKECASMGDYFLETKDDVRRIVEYSFNNMYSYYFAFRRFAGPDLSRRMPVDRICENASIHLETLNFVGLTEMLDVSVSMLGCALGLAGPPMSRLNETSAPELEQSVRSEILSNPGLQAKIKEFTALDNVLYERARDRFVANAEEHLERCPRCRALSGNTGAPLCGRRVRDWV